MWRELLVISRGAGTWGYISVQADWEDVMACSAFCMVQTGGVGVSANVRYSVREM